MIADLRAWANRVLAKTKRRTGKGKMDLLKEAGVGYMTFQNIVDDDAPWNDGKPTDDTIDKLVRVWELDPVEPYRILGKSVVSDVLRKEAPPAGYPDAPSPESSRVYRLLAADDRLVSGRRKARLNRALERALEDDRELAAEEGSAFYDNGPIGQSKGDGTS